MTFLLHLLIVAAAPHADDATCPATSFTLNKPIAPKAQQPKPESEKTKVAQAAPAALKPKPAPKPGDCATEKKKG